MANNNTIGLIDSQYVRDNTVVFQNVEDKFIEPSIIRTQNMYIKDILGASLYKTIITAYTDFLNNSTPVPSRISSLTDDYIAPILMHYIVADLLPDFYLKITAQGLSKSKDTENQTAPEFSDMMSLQKVYIDRAQYYASKLVNYLLLHTDIYPEYTTTDPDDNQGPNTTQYRGFYIGGSNNQTRNCCNY